MLLRCARGCCSQLPQAADDGGDALDAVAVGPARGLADRPPQGAGLAGLPAPAGEGRPVGSRPWRARTAGR
ncbi:hypothetical protein SMD11_2620 [Streptomyces albireticuli]|uniref:Uncharacterized protein n=1 Tax=Streptomyces albireticuli TaxID=1940 RepID=A0A1Z2L1U8_9ACTN|nr:hypothetical protein SMD11_2620 [Streptomyces albireticuli]